MGTLSHAAGDGQMDNQYNDGWRGLSAS